MKFGLAQNIIDNLIAVFEQHPKVDKALVFGSRAKGNYRPNSDIDIAIKGQDLNTDDIIAMSIAFEEKGITHKIDLINYNTINEPDLKDHIDRVGIEFYSRWKEVKLGDVITFQRGHDLTRTEMGEGKYPVAGSNGIIGYHNKFTTKGPGVTIGRSGNIGTPHFYENDFWAHNTVLYIKDFKVSEPKFIYYFLKTIDFSQFNAGSSVPTLNRNHIHELDFTLPPIQEQTAIASILTSLDDKIDLLHRQNKTLEQLAETLFRQWFVEEAEESWETKKVSEIIEIRDGTHDSPKQTETGRFLITSKHLKPAGIDFSSAYKISENDFIEVNKRSKVDKDDILFSMIGTLGLIHYVDQEPDFAIKNMGLFKSSQKPSFARFLFLLLISPEGKRFVHENADGSTQEYITLGSLRKFEFKYPGEKRIIEFDLEVKPVFQKINTNTSQIRTLTETRDKLLPKLMSGEVRVSISL